jgi:hypothetical protein
VKKKNIDRMRKKKKEKMEKEREVCIMEKKY